MSQKWANVVQWRLILTLSWLMSARNRLCFLYRSSFRGSCQYCACTRLIRTNTTSSRTTRQDSNSSGRYTAKRLDLLFLNQVAVGSTVQSFTDDVANVRALPGTARQPVHSWRVRKHNRIDFYAVGAVVCPETSQKKDDLCYHNIGQILQTGTET